MMLGAKAEPLHADCIGEIEQEVADIERLYEENQFLRKLNADIKQRIEKKQLQLGALGK